MTLSPPVLRNRDYRLAFQARVFAAMALQVQAVIVGWQLYQLHPDPLLLGMVGLVEAVPAIGFSFFSGHVVDTHKPARIYQLSIAVLFLNACALWLVVSPQLNLSEKLQIAGLFAAVFVSGAARSFTSPSFFSLVPRVVPRSLFGAASAWNSFAYQIASIIGPALGGLVFGKSNHVIAFSLPPVLALSGLASSLFLSKEVRDYKSDREREPFVKSMKAGLSFVFGNRVLLSSLALDMFSVLFGGAVALLPFFADQILKAGSEGLGYLRAAPSVGSLVVALYLAIRPLPVISGKTLLWVVAGFGAATVVFALSRDFTLSMIALGLAGAFDGVSMVIRGTILQILTPDQMRGRVSAVSSVFITSSNEIGAFESGVAARLLGLVPSVVFGGIMTLIVVVTTAWKVPELRRTRISQGE